MILEVVGVFRIGGVKGIRCGKEEFVNYIEVEVLGSEDRKVV